MTSKKKGLKSSVSGPLPSRKRRERERVLLVFDTTEVSDKDTVAIWKAITAEGDHVRVEVFGLVPEEPEPSILQRFLQVASESTRDKFYSGLAQIMVPLAARLKKYNIPYNVSFSKGESHSSVVRKARLLEADFMIVVEKATGMFGMVSGQTTVGDFCSEKASCHIVSGGVLAIPNNKLFAVFIVLCSLRQRATQHQS